MGEFEHREEERLSRQEAAERLIDIAYALAAGGPLQLRAAGRRIEVPLANELVLGREVKAKGDRVALEVELSWSTPRRVSGLSAAPRQVRGDRALARG